MFVGNCLTLATFTVVKNFDYIAKFFNVNTRRKYAFLHRASGKFQNFVLQFHTELATLTGLMKNEKFSILFLIKQNLPNSINLLPINGVFKAWSHSLTKTN